MKQVRRAGWSVALIAAFAVCGAYGDDVTITSTYDAETDTWIGDVVALTNALKNAEADQTIYLEKGVYDLSSLSDDRAPMHLGNGGYGYALIGLDKSSAQLVGATGHPEDVVIFATNSEYRILNLSGTGTHVHNVTIKGGYASTNGVSKNKGEFIGGYMAGGGVMFIGSSTVVSNCHFTANRGASGGGAVSGNNGYNGTVYDSVFYGNDSSGNAGMALAARYTTLRGCTVTNNSYSGENLYVAALRLCRVYDSYVANNKGTMTGGLYEGLAVDSQFLFNNQIYRSSPSSNWSGGGGGATRDATLTNCFFYGNTAYRLGGAIRGGRAVNCTVTSNRIIRSNNDAYAGGIYSSTVLNCTVVSNVGVYGGGVSHCTVIGGTNAYNVALEGGGANSSALTGCYIAHNVAKTYANSNYGGAGGGMRYGAATNCVFRDNSCSVAYLTGVLKDCDIADTSINAKMLDSCVIHDVKNDEMRRSIGNVAYPDGTVMSNIFMMGGVQFMRNCLITNCHWRSIPGSFVNSALFTPNVAVTTRVESCTFADNYYYHLSRHYSATNKTLALVNTILTGNKHPTVGDVVSMESAYLVLSNCVYGKMGSCTPKAEGFTNYGCTSITERAAYKFTGKDPDPYSLRRSSPLRGWGLVLDWMEDGTDLAGNPRLRDGAVDIGCYQCWLDPVGAVFSIR